MEEEERGILATAKRIFNFYIDGFKNMRLGKRLWLIIAVKFFIIFIVIKLLFFPNFLENNFDNDNQRSSYILEQLTQKG